MSYTILLAEDDADIADLVSLYLESSGYQVLVAADGEEAYGLFLSAAVDLAVLDIMMPGLNGYDLVRRIRQTSNIPLLILSAKRENQDKILGLDLGADDYITKPFDPLEITARVKSHLRRYHNLGASQSESSPDRLNVGELVLDLQRMTVEKGGRPLALTATEFKILHALMLLPGQVLTRQQLYHKAAGSYMDSDEHTMMVHISNLREKLETDPRQPDYIKTVRGVGYKIEKHDET